MKLALSLLVLFSSTASFAAGGVSSRTCVPDAIEQTEKLLRFHNQVGPNEQIDNHVKPDAKDVKALPPEKLGGKGELQVLEVTTGIYKAEYTAVMKYAEIPDRNNPSGVACILMGESISDRSNPF